MKISIVLRDISERGGGERVCANLANALAKQYQVQIISFYQSNQTLSYELDSQIKLVFLSSVGEKSGGKIKALFRRIFYRYILTLKAQKYLKDSQIILANDRALAPICKQKKTSYIRLWHLYFPKRRRNLDFFDALVVPSSKEIDAWRQIHPNVFVIPNFLPQCFQGLTQWNVKNILSVGRMDRGDQKGFLRLLDIFAKVASLFPDWKLTLVGEGILEKELKEKIQKLKLAHQVTLKPFTQTIEEEYLRSSIYVMASYFEGFGMVLAESGSCGLPSIAFDVRSGPSDIIQEGKSGFLIKDGDLENFAFRLQELMDSEILREKMGKEAKSRVDALFSQEVVLSQWHKLFKDLEMKR